MNEHKRKKKNKEKWGKKWKKNRTIKVLESVWSSRLEKRIEQCSPTRIVFRHCACSRSDSWQSISMYKLIVAYWKYALCIHMIFLSVCVNWVSHCIHCSIEHSFNNRIECSGFESVWSSERYSKCSLSRTGTTALCTRKRTNTYKHWRQSFKCFSTITTHQDQTFDRGIRVFADVLSTADYKPFPKLI